MTAGGASGSPQTVNVTLNVSAPIITSPTLSITGGPLTFAYQTGSAVPGAQNLSASVSSGSSSFTATSNAAWLQVSPGIGTLGASATPLSISVVPGSLAAGSYNGTITVTASGASGSPQIVNVTLNVATTVTPPSIQSGVTYVTFKGATLTLYPWIGNKVAVLTSGNNLDTPTMNSILAALDSAYGIYEQITGSEPNHLAATTLNGRDVIAEVPDGATCAPDAA